MLKRLLFIGACALLSIANSLAGELCPDNSIFAQNLRKHGTVIGEEGKDGQIHMHPGYSFHSEVRYWRDDYGYVHAEDHYYVRYKGRRITD